ncbi:MAG: hypothetical protein SPI42_04490 [Lactobacillus johnsonii]|nr:hypothetical protein [Lactobacillus johnsonii]MDY6195388.1 hypothetical protein [Lactobacillus johnsonii]
MLRAEIEQFMKKNNMNHIVLMIRPEDRVGFYCELKAGYLSNYVGRRFDRKLNVWGWIKYDGNGNADVVDWEESVSIPFLRNGFKVDKYL